MDVSACIPWCCEDEITPGSEQTFEWATQGSALHVPALRIWEVLNVLAVAVRRRRISRERSKQFLEQLGAFNFVVDGPPRIAELPRIQTLIERYELTAYDVAYLELAMRLSLPLASQDGDLREAASSEGVEVLG